MKNSYLKYFNNYTTNFKKIILTTKKNKNNIKLSEIWNLLLKKICKFLLILNVTIYSSKI